MMQCKLLLLESRPEYAHRKLMHSLSYYYATPNKAPLLLLKQAIPLMDFFGEFAIKRCLLTLLAAKSGTALKLSEQKNSDEETLGKDTLSQSRCASSGYRITTLKRQTSFWMRALNSFLSVHYHQIGLTGSKIIFRDRIRPSYQYLLTYKPHSGDE